MTKKIRTAFFASPGFPEELKRTIDNAAEKLKNSDQKISFRLWSDMDTFGANIPDQVRDSIKEVDALICDITVANHNVYYEMGYAIGSGKTIAPVVNSSFQNAISNIQKDGFFDGIGHKRYENSSDLVNIIQDISPHSLLDLYSKPINYKQSLFLLDTFSKTEFRNSIVSAIKNSKIYFRSFDPIETPRFSSVSMISDITASSGIIIPILSQQIEDAARHNLRAAFLAGLSQGLGRPTLLIRLMSQASSTPMDYRDSVRDVRSEADIAEIVAEFAATSHVAGQSVSNPQSLRASRSDLQKLSLGSSKAEDEFRTLDDYFVETAEYIRTIRGDVRVVAGRKGSGKTAIFFQSRDLFRQQKNSFVTDLKPESHQLSAFREELLKVADSGVFDHTLSSFWTFVILSEILLTIQRHFEARSKFDSNALLFSREIGVVLADVGVNQSGDFTSRINRLGKFVLQEIESMNGRGEKISVEKLTNIFFRSAIAPIRALISKHTNANSLIILLFDNIDKGWPSKGVDPFDIRLIRLLVESLDKIRHDFATADRDFRSVIFLRNDIFELMVSDTSDRGKAGQIRIDWTDRAKMRQIIFKRIQTSLAQYGTDFDGLWGRFFEEQVDGTHSFEFLLDHCLMRPRFLLNLVDICIANAINRGKIKVQKGDLLDAVRQHSLHLIDDFGFEIRDVSGIHADILYSLVGITKYCTKKELFQCFSTIVKDETKLEEVMGLMLWYGIIGIVDRNKKENYIYDYEYNMKRLGAEIAIIKAEAQYVINPALFAGLNS